ncbi:MAG: fumarylacetoacetate hydrolase family protein, partial [Microbacteriaceae bacterium]
MKLATLRTDHRTSAVLISAETATEITGVPDVGALLKQPEWRSMAASAHGTAHTLASIAPAQWAPVIPFPSKILCVGHNYRNHILEMGREPPEYPTFFNKYPEALIGAFDDIELSPISDAVDWEGELAVIIGSPARNLDEAAAERAIAGYAIMNDVSMRDYQYRTLQWLQGKTFENSSPFGPYLVTPDEFTLGATLTTTVNGEVMQDASTADLIFTPATLISYFSR